MNNVVYLSNYCGLPTTISQDQFELIAHNKIGSAIRSGINCNLINSLMSNSNSMNKVARSFKTLARS